MEVKKTDCTAVNPEIVNQTQKTMPDLSAMANLSDFFKVMGDNTRIRLLCAIDKNELCVCDLAVLLDMTKSAVSHQLKSLRQAKLIKSRKEGKHVFYSLDDEHVRLILEMGLDHVCEKSVVSDK